MKITIFGPRVDKNTYYRHHIEAMERNITRNLGPKAELGSRRSESGYQRIAQSVSGRIACELGLNELKAQALSLAVGFCFPKYGHEGLKAVKQYILDRNIDMNVNSLEVVAAFYSVYYARIHNGEMRIVDFFYELITDYFSGANIHEECKVVKLVQETILEVKKAEIVCDCPPGELLLEATQELVDLAAKNKTLTEGSLLKPYADKIASYPFPTLSDAEYEDVYNKLDSLISSFCGETLKVNRMYKDPEEVVTMYVTSGLWCE